MTSNETMTEGAAAEKRLQKRATARVPQLILVLRCDRPSVPGARFSLAAVDEIEIGRGEDAVEETDAGWLWSVDDALISRVHARLTRCRNGWQLTDLGSKNGTFVEGARVKESLIRDGDIFRVGSSFFALRVSTTREESEPQVTRFASARELTAFSTLSAELAQQFAVAETLAKSELTVLVTGETGSGKELVARELHDLSQREGPFVPVNCGAIAENLARSEFFGHKRGAFSGAHADNLGLIRKADRGTLFLDEIAELSDSSQAALLRVLQEGEVRSVGSNEAVPVDTRVVAATLRDLSAKVSDGSFREDLYSRLVGHIVRLPPLRERSEDIGLIIARVIAEMGELQPDFEIDPEVGRALLDHAYPRNVRELVLAFRKAIVLSRGGPLAIEHFPDELSSGAKPEPLALPPPETKRELVAVLSEEAGNVSATARRYGKAPGQVRRWCRRFGIDPSTFRNGS